MPKPSHKSRKKLTAEKQLDTDIRQKITAAVDELSKSAAAQVAIASQGEVARGEVQKILLWIGVAIITITILTFWLINLQSIFTDLRMAPASNESRFLQEAKADIDTALEKAAAPKPANAETETAIRESLQSILKGN